VENIESAPATPDLVIELGAGGKMKPAYESAADYEVSPFPIFKLDYLSLPGLFTIGGGDDLGFSLGPSFDTTGKRDSSEHSELSGLDDIDATYEVGLKAGYEWSHAEVYAEARYAFGGAEGFVGNMGANAILHPAAGLEVKFGPIASFAGSDYMDTYFGVTPAESISTGGRLSAYDAEGGIKSAGVAMEVRYEFRQDWFLNMEASYTSMLGDAEDSPVVDAGESDQFTLGLGVSRRFSLDLFD
jgi:outer membrane protein